MPLDSQEGFTGPHDSREEPVIRLISPRWLVVAMLLLIWAAWSLSEQVWAVSDADPALGTRSEALAVE